MNKERCKVCGCTNNKACDGGCWWVAKELCSKCANSLIQENENLRATIKNDDVAVNNLCKEIEILKQQLKDKDEKISKAIEYCNGSAFEVSTREYGMLNVINYEDVLEILESNKED